MTEASQAGCLCVAGPDPGPGLLSSRPQPLATGVRGLHSVSSKASCKTRISPMLFLCTVFFCLGTKNFAATEREGTWGRLHAGGRPSCGKPRAAPRTSRPVGGGRRLQLRVSAVAPRLADEQETPPKGRLRRRSHALPSARDAGLKTELEGEAGGRAASLAGVRRGRTGGSRMPPAGSRDRVRPEGD